MGVGRPTDKLRTRAARGVLVNAAFTVMVRTLGFIKGFVVAAFLTTSEYGTWGILLVGLGTLFWLRELGIGDKYVQQTDDEAEAFQEAFTLELISTGALTLLLALAVPLLALAYGDPDLLLPGYVVVLAVPAMAFQAPLWIFYRSMDFLRQRALLAVDPVVSFILTLSLAVAGAGYWSFVIAYVVGAWAAAATAIRFSPHPLRLRSVRGTWREYFSFSWPLAVAGVAGIVIAQGTMLAGEAELGLAGAGAIALAVTISQYADEVDRVVTDALYPAICAVLDRTELLYETFVKSNRLALMWAVPFGVSLALFAPDLVDFALGDKWEPAVLLLQVFGLTAAAGHVGFNLQAFFMARAETRPLMVVNIAAMIAFLGCTLPLILSHGLDGLAIGTGVMTLVVLAGRMFFAARLFRGFRLARHLLRAFLPAVPATAAVLVLRLLESGERTAIHAVSELTLYTIGIVAATAAFERDLVREALGYLRGGARRGALAPEPHG
jgi:O-antigen/teichoic acid export membrane protein